MSKYDVVGIELQKQLDQVLQRVGKIERDLRSVHDRDSQERASELENDQVLEGLDEMSRAEVRRIREALERIRTGSYGTCAKCGLAIGAERLVAVPTTLTCVSCAP
jgi:DnaK suppressor protein